MDAVHLAEAANLVRRDMLKMKSEFTGSFEAQCQENSVPVSFLALVSMMLYGTNITTQTSYAKCLKQLSASHSYSCTTVW